MSAADQRIAALLERWRTSVELHARYLELDAAAYAKVQKWPKHERPTRWVIDLARARIEDLKRLHAERMARGDEGFAEALESMGLLANLVGVEHVERFVPLAVAAPPPPRTRDRPRPDAKAVDPTIEQTAPHKARTAASGRAADRPRTSARTTRKAAPAAAVEPRPEKLDKVAAQVVADAVRLLNWGREWPQVAGLIARLADRPSEQDVWKILRSHRATIEAKANRPLD